MELTVVGRESEKGMTRSNGLFLWEEEKTFRIPEGLKKWEGRWIWAPEEEYPQYQKCAYTLFAPPMDSFSVFLFQKKWTMKETAQKAVLYISSDASCKIYINGRTIGWGSAQPGGDYGNTQPVGWKFYGIHDVTEYLCPGENILTVRVCLGAVVQSEISCGHGGLIAQLEMEMDEKWERIVSDSTWKCRREEAFSASNVWDGNFTCPDDEKGYRDESWGYAEEVADQGQFPELFPAAIPNLKYVEVSVQGLLDPFDISEERRISWNRDFSEIRVRKGAPLTFWLDFGAIYAGIPHFDIEGGQNCRLVFSMQEFAGKTERGGTIETVTLREGRNRFESLRLHSVHYIQITVSNFTRDVVIRMPGIHVSVYPTGMPGSFQCSEPLYEKIYMLGARTNQICRQTYHMDSPIHQEPLGCMGDYMIESLMNYYTFGDAYLPRFDILKIAAYLHSRDYRMFHASYCLLYIQMIEDYLLYNDDMELPGLLQPVITGVLERFLGYLGENMLIEKAPSYMFMDWVSEGRFNRHHPPKCMGQGYLTMMLAGALKTACRILSGKLDSCSETRYQEYARRITQSLQEKLWREERGLFVDGLYDSQACEDSRWLPADENKEFFSQHTNTLAVLYDIIPRGRQKDLMEKVMTDSHLSQAQPYFLHFVLNALHKTGLFEKYGLSIISRWGELLAENPSGLKEVFYGFDCDYSHAWGGTPTYQLPARILGVVPVSFGFREIVFEPCLPTQLSWAKGTIPTPHGKVQVSLWREDGELRADIDCPDGISIRKTDSE